MSTNMTTVGRGAAVVGALVALKLIFGRRRKPKQNKEQTRELDSASMLQFQDVQKTQDTAQEERMDIEQIDTQQAFTPVTQNVDDIQIAQQQSDVIHAANAESIPRESAPIVVDFDTTDENRLQLQLKKDEEIQKDQEIQKVNVEFKVDFQNHVQVYFDGTRNIDEIQKIEEIQQEQEIRSSEVEEQQQIEKQLPESIVPQQLEEEFSPKQIEEEFPQQDQKSVNVEYKVDSKNNIEVYFDGEREVQEVSEMQESQEIAVETKSVVPQQDNVEQVTQQLLDENQQIDANLQTRKTDDQITQIFEQTTNQKDDQNQVQVQFSVDQSDAIRLDLMNANDTQNIVNEINNQFKKNIKFGEETQVQVPKQGQQEEEEEVQDEEDDINSMQVETSSQTTQFSIPELTPHEKSFSENFDYETIKEVSIENQENSLSQNIQLQQKCDVKPDVESSKIGGKSEVQDSQNGLENYRTIETPSDTENKQAVNVEESAQKQQEMEGNENVAVQANLQESVQQQQQEEGNENVAVQANLQEPDQNGQKDTDVDQKQSVVDSQELKIAEEEKKEPKIAEEEKKESTEETQKEDVSEDQTVEEDSKEEDEEEVEDEKLSQCEEDSQRMVAMANKLWGSGTPAEIKRAVKMQTAALEKLQEGDGRPVYVAQVASSLADMQYALNDLSDSRQCLQVALNAANLTGDVALTSKLSNNLGQIMRQMKSFEAAKNLHKEYMERFEPEYGVGHHYTCLARQNLVESLEALEQLDEAKEILERSSETCINAIKELESPTNPDEETQEREQTKIQGDIQQGEGEVEDEELVGVDWTYICSGRVLTEQARFEVSHSDTIGDRNKAEELLRLALAYIEKGEGADGQSSATPLSYLGKVLTSKGGNESLQEAYDVYERLRKISLKRDGENSQSVALVLHTQADVLGQLEQYEKAVELEEESLKILRTLLKQKYHMGLIKHYEALAKLKQAAGDGEGAQAASRDVLLCKKRHQEEQMKLKRATSSAHSGSSSSKSSTSSKSPSLSKSSSKRRSKDKKKAK